MTCSERCMTWDPPDLDCLPCLPHGVTTSQVCLALQEANEAIWLATGGRYSGCDCVAQLKVCPDYCRCVNYCDPCSTEMIDLKSFLDGQTVHEVVSVVVDGVESAGDGWQILSNRYLKMPAGGWPSVRSRYCAWSVKVRYGTKPPLGLLRYRNQHFMNLLKCYYPASALACSTEGMESVRFKGTSYTFSPNDPIRQAALEYGPNPMAMSFFSDPGDPGKQYKIENLGSYSMAGEFDCDAWLADSFSEETVVDDGTVDVSPDQPQQTVTSPPVKKLYDEYGRPAN